MSKDLEKQLENFVSGRAFNSEVVLEHLLEKSGSGKTKDYSKDFEKLNNDIEKLQGEMTKLDARLDKLEKVKSK